MVLMSVVVMVEMSVATWATPTVMLMADWLADWLAAKMAVLMESMMVDRTGEMLVWK